MKFTIDNDFVDDPEGELDPILFNERDHTAKCGCSDFADHCLRVLMDEEQPW